MNSRMSTLLIDSNVLLVYILGLFRKELIDSHRRTGRYTQEDWTLLEQFLQANNFQTLAVTPGVLTEVSNLLAYGLNGRLRDNLFRYVAGIIPKFQEEHQDASRIVAASAFIFLGYTDAGIGEVARAEGIPVLTDDLKLYIWLLREKLSAFNFNHIRDANWSL